MRLTVNQSSFNLPNQGKIYKANVGGRSSEKKTAKGDPMYLVILESEQWEKEQIAIFLEKEGKSEPEFFQSLMMVPCCMSGGGLAFAEKWAREIGICKLWVADDHPDDPATEDENDWLLLEEIVELPEFYIKIIYGSYEGKKQAKPDTDWGIDGFMNRTNFSIHKAGGDPLRNLSTEDDDDDDDDNDGNDSNNDNNDEDIKY